MRYGEGFVFGLRCRCAHAVAMVGCAALLMMHAFAVGAVAADDGEIKAIRRGSGVPVKVPATMQPSAPSDQVTGSNKTVSSVSPAALPSSGLGDLYAVCVGVCKYKSPAIPPLTVSAKDAADFAKFLKTQKDFFRNVFVTVLADEAATKFEVERQLYYELRKAGKNDTIVLFLSGHGTIDPKRPGQFFFLTHDADPEVLELTSVNMSGLKMLSDLDCQRVVLIADACHAGGFSKWRTKLAVVPLKNFMNDFSSASGRVVITSSRPEEYSLEGVRFGNSVFTHFLLEGLAGASDSNGDGIVTVNEAYAYAYAKTKTFTEGAQHPQFEGVVEGVFPLAATTELRSRPPTSLEIKTNPPMAEVFVAGRFVGKTDGEGAICIKYLPMDQPIPVKLKKEGWRDVEVGPFTLTQEKMEFSADPVSLPPCTGALEIKTNPGKVSVKMDGKSVGTTNGAGLLLVQGVQVALPHKLEFVKPGFEERVSAVTIPAAQEGNTFQCTPVELQKLAKDRSATASPANHGTPVERGAPSQPKLRSEDYSPPRSSAPRESTSPSSPSSSGSDRDFGL